MLSASAGDRYEGEFKNDKRHGKGVLHWVSGNRYGPAPWRSWAYCAAEGEFNDDKRTGFGTYFYANGDWFEGYFLNGKRDGLGFAAEGQEVFEEEWEEGSRVSRRVLPRGLELLRGPDRFGTRVYSNGDTYTGSLINNMVSQWDMPPRQLTRPAAVWLRAGAAVQRGDVRGHVHLGRAPRPRHRRVPQRRPVRSLHGAVVSHLAIATLAPGAEA